jgi:hypothetical protein
MGRVEDELMKTVSVFEEIEGEEKKNLEKSGKNFSFSSSSSSFSLPLFNLLSPFQSEIIRRFLLLSLFSFFLSLLRRGMGEVGKE